MPFGCSRAHLRSGLGNVRQDADGDLRSLSNGRQRHIADVRDIYRRRKGKLKYLRYATAPDRAVNDYR